MTDPFLKKRPEITKTSDNQTTPTNNGENQQTKKIKKWTKISMKWFLIWCLIMFVVILWVTTLVLMTVLSNPDLLKSYGLESDTIKSLLMFFTVIFFWILFFVWFSLLTLNWYRFFSQPTSKIKHWITAFLWLAFFLFSLVFWAMSIIKIRNISPDTQIKTDNIVDPYIVTKDWKQDALVWIWKAPKTIAPAYFQYKINKEQFNTKIIPEVWSVDRIVSLQLDCGNWQLLKASREILFTEDWLIPWKCLYIEKRSYPVKLKYTYYDKKSQNETESEINVWDINIDSIINIRNGENALKLNDNKSEILLWQAPASVEFDGTKIFTDLELNENKIEWDFDWDQKIDIKDKSLVRYEYKQPGKYDITFKLPWYSDFTYYFSLRTNESDIPPCELKMSNKWWSNYLFTAIIDDKLDIKKFEYELIDTNSTKTIQTETVQWKSFNFKVPLWWVYKIKYIFTTSDGKQWTCESEDIDTKLWNYNMDVEVATKSWSDAEFEPQVISWNNVVISVLPSTVKLSINNITPEDPNLKKLFYIDWSQIDTSNGDNEIQFDINEKKEKILMVVIEDEKGRKSEYKYNFTVNEKPIIAKLKATPSVWEDPLEVELDASISKINSLDDEIVYFSWDFWDGQSMSNISQWKVSHTYRFNKETNEWKYFPKVTVQTKNWYEDTTTLATPILVKRQVRQIKIISESHPTQIAHIWEIVKLSIEWDWEIKNISWDFGNSKKTSCETRECSSVSTSYEKTGMYTVTISVEYKDYPTTTSSIKIKIIE